MALSAILLTLLGQELGAPQAQTTTDLNAPLSIAEPNRLAVTPLLDGILADEEWDPFVDTPTSKSFLQWEPGKLYVAGIVPKGSDLVVSIDVRDDGWLKGKDNIEVRASLRGDKVVLKARQLDNTGKEGPAWTDLPLVTASSAGIAKEGESNTFFELAIAEGGVEAFNPNKGDRLGVRCDTVPAEATDIAPFLPRAMGEIKLATVRDAGMPAGLEVGVQDGFQSVIPGENVRLRVTFKGKNEMQLQKLEMRSEGEAREKAVALTTPFPYFDTKGRAFVDYDTRIDPSATLGYRILRATVTAGDGLPGIIEASYRIAPQVDFYLIRPKVASSTLTRKVRVFYGVRSNSVNRVPGSVVIDLPDGWRNLTTVDKGYTIYKKGLAAERYIDVEIPGGAHGTFPITMRSILGNSTVEQKVWLTVE